MATRDRRYQKRLAVSTRIRISTVDNKASRSVNAYLLEVKNMTHRGLFVGTQEILPIGTLLKIEIELPLPAEAVNATAKVAWIAKPSQTAYYPGMGISIIRIKRGDGKKIDEFLKYKLLNYRHALELKNMYAQLKEMAARLYELERQHMQAEHFKKVIDHAITEIDSIAHILDREVWEIKRL
jgi:Tfp pilus assembly protein PilZ